MAVTLENSTNDLLTERGLLVARDVTQNQCLWGNARFVQCYVLTDIYTWRLRVVRRRRRTTTTTTSYDDDYYYYYYYYYLFYLCSLSTDKYQRHLLQATGRCIPCGSYACSAARVAGRLPRTRWCRCCMPLPAHRCRGRRTRTTSLVVSQYQLVSFRVTLHPCSQSGSSGATITTRKQDQSEIDWLSKA